MESNEDLVRRMGSKKTKLKVNYICKVKFIDRRVGANKKMLSSVFEARVTDYTATSVSHGKLKGLLIR